MPEKTAGLTPTVWPKIVGPYGLLSWDRMELPNLSHDVCAQNCENKKT